MNTPSHSMKKALLLVIFFGPSVVLPQNMDSALTIWNDPAKPDSARLKAIETVITGIQYAQIDSAEKLANLMHAAATKAALPLSQAKALELKGNSYYLRGDNTKAMATYIQALGLYKEQRNARGIAGALDDMANVHGQLGRFDLSEELHRKTLQIVTLLNDTQAMAKDNNNLGRDLLYKGDLTQASEHFLNSIKLNGLIGNEKDNLNSYGNLSVALAQQKDFPRALHYAEKALEIARQNNNKGAEASLLMNMGGFAVEMKDHEKGLELHRLALALNTEIGNQRGVMASEFNIGEALGDMEDHVTAVQHLQRSLEIARAMKDDYQVAAALGGLAGAYTALGEFDKGVDLGETALASFQQMGSVVDIEQAARVLSETYQRMGRFDKAFRMYQLTVQMRDSVMSEENQRGVLRNEYGIENIKRALADSLEFVAEKAIQQKEIQKQKIIRNGFVGGFALVALFAGVFLFQRNRISKEKARSEELLLNILPAEVAEELKAKGEAEAVQIDLVTVLFTDFKGFTALSEILSPRELVKDLNECFSGFDRITSKYGIEKIKTIGDAYMAAGGLPTPNTTHAIDVVHAALEMRDFVAEGKARKMAAGLPFFEVRIGIHTGPVVAGIVGVKKFQYDIWGDTVNTASRMESSGEPGMVNISEATYELVNKVKKSGSEEAAYTFTPRGKVQAKGKGEMEMYFVEKV